MNKTVDKLELGDDELKRRRKNTVLTALVLGAIALGIFVAFVGSAVLGH